MAGQSENRQPEEKNVSMVELYARYDELLQEKTDVEMTAIIERLAEERRIAWLERAEREKREPRAVALEGLRNPVSDKVEDLVNRAAARQLLEEGKDWIPEKPEEGFVNLAEIGKEATANAIGEIFRNNVHIEAERMQKRIKQYQGNWLEAAEELDYYRKIHETFKVENEGSAAMRLREALTQHAAIEKVLDEMYPGEGHKAMDAFDELVRHKTPVRSTGGHEPSPDNFLLRDAMEKNMRRELGENGNNWKQLAKYVQKEYPDIWKENSNPETEVAKKILKNKILDKKAVELKNYFEDKPEEYQAVLEKHSERHIPLPPSCERVPTVTIRILMEDLQALAGDMEAGRLADEHGTPPPSPLQAAVSSVQAEEAAAARAAHREKSSEPAARKPRNELWTAVTNAVLAASTMFLMVRGHFLGQKTPGQQPEQPRKTLVEAQKPVPEPRSPAQETSPEKEAGNVPPAVTISKEHSAGLAQLLANNAEKWGIPALQDNVLAADAALRVFARQANANVDLVKPGDTVTFRGDANGTIDITLSQQDAFGNPVKYTGTVSPQQVTDYRREAAREQEAIRQTLAENRYR